MAPSSVPGLYLSARKVVDTARFALRSNSLACVVNRQNITQYMDYTAEDFAWEGIPGIPAKLDESQLCKEGCKKMTCEDCNRMYDDAHGKDMYWVWTPRC